MKWENRETLDTFSKSDSSIIIIIYIDPKRGGFDGILPEVMIFSEVLCPEENK
jgi:hypothetical protein